MKRKIQFVNSGEAWDANRRYKINAIVTHNGLDWQNTTGKNSEPGVGTDWETPSNTLQSITAGINKNLLNNNNFQGTDAGFDNTGTEVNAFGYLAANLNTGISVNALGTTAGQQNTGTSVNALGNMSAFLNTGTNVNAFGDGAGNGNTANEVNFFGSSAGNSNTFKSVNLFGHSADADADNQTVFSKWVSAITKYLARISFNNITANRKWELPDFDGTFLLEVITQRSTATSGTVSAADIKNSIVFIHEAGVTATLTYEFPRSPIDKQRVTLMSVGGIVALTLTAATGTIMNTTTAFAAGGSATYMYLASQTKWYKIG
jgi:hypothetical protein